MSEYLLDANTLIALAWPAHEHHQKIHAWFQKNHRFGWATTAFTQAAFIRIVSQPAFSGGISESAIGPREAADILARNTAHVGHKFLTSDMQVSEVLSVCTGGIDRATNVGKQKRRKNGAKTALKSAAFQFEKEITSSSLFSLLS